MLHQSLLGLLELRFDGLGVNESQQHKKNSAA